MSLVVIGLSHRDAPVPVREALACGGDAAMTFLKALVAFDLKIGEFEPEHAGKMDFYLNLLNEKERGPDDRPSIGIILCAEKDDVEVEFALRTKINPIGVAEYQLQDTLPAEFKGKLPTAKQLAEVAREFLPTAKAPAKRNKT